MRRGTDLAKGIGISERVATNDRRRLVEKGLLVPIGGRRGRYYVASDRLKKLRSATREPRRPIRDPFA